ncbi:MAG: AMP-binding protein, partial [Candidatus Omnitrophica bacterium]|nr:AMP-binding protein [Candidatus Omnitrophota bacterium]
SKDDIAYLLFTSGSTGEPKGVPVSHQNVRSYVEFLTKRYDLNENDRCSQMHDMTFDFSVHDIYPTWEAGACLYVATKQDKLFPVSYIQKNKLTSWASVPSIGVIIDKYGRLEPGAFPDLRYSFFCGEALYLSTAEKWQAAANNSKIVNLYGPTEATMAIAYYDWDSQTSPSECLNGIVPIGKVFDGQEGRVVRENQHEASVDEAGELYLRGSQVTKGYWNNPEKTATQYVTLPDTGDTLWYRTGDLVREDNDRCMYYLGRIDNQVQILGNRVELGEIDKILREISDSEHAVSVPWPVSGGNASGLVAFISTGKTLDENSVLEFCRSKLPKYMVPMNVCFVDRMPLNANGKVDRIQLNQLLEKHDQN